MNRDHRTANPAALFCGVGLLNFMTWMVLFALVPSRSDLLELGAVAYFLGVRHGFDADHIAAIDNVTRRLQQARRPSSSCGFFFALGHSTIVILMTLGVVMAASPQARPLVDWTASGSTAGTFISALFLTLIGVFNLVALIELWGAFRLRLHTADGPGEIDRQINELLERRGVAARTFRFIYQRIDSGWKMYFVGLLFGMGFDTATEIALLALAAGAAAHGDFPFWIVMILPLLFTSGMTLIDTLDGVMMARVYEWAADNHDRKFMFNIAVTAMTVLIALLIGTIEWLRVIAAGFGLNGRFWEWVNALDFTRIGIVIVAALVLVWLSAWWTYRRQTASGLAVKPVMSGRETR
jgi:high-affinity nickel-transport protein